MPETRIRIEAIFSGHVQGVWFRGTCFDLAEGRAIVGFVENHDDGNVFLVAEGMRGDLEAFLAAIKQAKAPNIRHYSVSYLDASGEFSDFQIRR